MEFIVGNWFRNFLKPMIQLTLASKANLFGEWFQKFPKPVIQLTLASKATLSGFRNFRNQNWLKVMPVLFFTFQFTYSPKKVVRKFLTTVLTIKVSPRLKPDGQMSLSNYGTEKSGFGTF